MFHGCVPLPHVNQFYVNLTYFATTCRKNLTMDEIHDIHGLRLIVENEDDCYKALQLVHQLWPEVPGKFKDYIKRPKCNGYVILLYLTSPMLGLCLYDFMFNLRSLISPVS